MISISEARKLSATHKELNRQNEMEEKDSYLLTAFPEIMGSVEDSIEEACLKGECEAYISLMYCNPYMGGQNTIIFERKKYYGIEAETISRDLKEIVKLVSDRYKSHGFLVEVVKKDAVPGSTGLYLKIGWGE